MEGLINEERLEMGTDTDNYAHQETHPRDGGAENLHAEVLLLVLKLWVRLRGGFRVEIFRIAGEKRWGIVVSGKWLLVAARTREGQ